MSFAVDIKQNTITIDGENFDVDETTDNDGDIRLTIEQDGEQVYEGIEGLIGYETYDAHIFDPRQDDNLGVMFCDYRGYSLGDDDAPDPRDHMVECGGCEGTGEITGLSEIEGGVDTCADCDGAGEIELDPIEYLRREHGATVIMPLYVYEHSGITIRAGAPVGPMLTGDDVRSSGRFVGDAEGWDTSTVGFIFDTAETRERMGTAPEHVEEALRAEVEVYASYLEGDVTYYRVEDEETGYDDACGGFVGGWGDHTREEAYGSLALAIKARRREEIERANAAARDIITV